jgi:DNA-binding protein
MERNKAVGPDGLPIEFYQSYWEIIKEDMVDLFRDFYMGNLDVKRINYGTISLIPKVKEAERMQQFRPICLLNCLYKWITKCLTFRLEPVAARLIHKSQTTFIKRKDIMNSILALLEILHETKIKRKVEVVLKLDFEKAYDKIN